MSYFRALRDGSCTPATEPDHHKLLTAGQIIRLTPDYIVGRNILTSGYCLGLDNSVLLPPWLPVLRSQDLAFGALLRTVRQDDLFCIFPWAIRHERPEARSFSREDVRKRFAQINGGELVSGLIQDFAEQKKEHAQAALAVLGGPSCRFPSPLFA